MSNQYIYAIQNTINQESLFSSPSINIESDILWTEEIHQGQDASFIIRKRALLFDLFNLEVPETSLPKSSSENIEITEELAYKTYRDFAQSEFLKDMAAEKDIWIEKNLELEDFFDEKYFKKDVPYKNDDSWLSECLPNVQ